MNKKEELQKYFQLLASICLGRNYNTIKDIKTDFPFDKLVDTIKNDQILP